jgi:transposase
MDHVAIDLGGRESQVCVRDASGQILEERRVETSELKTYLAKRPAGRVILETCSEAFCVADAALAAGHEARVVPATLVRSLGVGARRTKTDRRDAQILSEVSARIDLPSVHIPSRTSRERKSICGMREALVRARTLLINTVRGWLRQEAITIRVGPGEYFVAKLRKRIETPLPAFVERQVTMIESLSEQIAEADDDLRAMAKEDSTCKRLMTVPGVGPVTALRFVAALDKIDRFDGAHRVQSYLGLAPGENSSSDRKQRTSITKAGSPELRATLVQAAWCARRTKGSHPMIAWALEVEKRRGKRVAVIALARKLAGILFAIWRDGTVYDRSHHAAHKAHMEAKLAST